MDAKIEALVLVVRDATAMAAFYAGVFGVSFETLEVEGSIVHQGHWCGLDLALVPEALSEVKVSQNPIHFDIFVDDLEEGIQRVERSGGRTNGQLGEDDELRAIGIYDPDDNFMVFKQRKASGGESLTLG